MKREVRARCLAPSGSAKPGSVGSHFVRRVHSGDGVFAGTLSRGLGDDEVILPALAGTRDEGTVS